MSVAFLRSPARFRQHAVPFTRLLVAFLVLFYGWTAFANVQSASHDPFAQATHAPQHAMGADDGHGHDHDDGQEGPISGGVDASAHQHGHDAADHSHEKQNLTRRAAPVELASSEHWVPLPMGFPPPAPYFAFERPPRSIPSL